MFYPYIEKQTLMQYLLNTFTPSMWFRPLDCECSWQKPFGRIMWVILAGCPRHD